MPQEEQGTQKSFHQLKYLCTKWIGPRTQKIIRLGTHQRIYVIPHKKVFSVKLSIWWQESEIFCNFCSTLDFQWRNHEDQKKAKTTDFNVF